MKIKACLKLFRGKSDYCKIEKENITCYNDYILLAVKGSWSIL